MCEGKLFSPMNN